MNCFSLQIAALDLGDARIPGQTLPEGTPSAPVAGEYGFTRLAKHRN